MKSWHVSSSGLFRTRLEIDYGASRNIVLNLHIFKDSAEFDLDGVTYTMRHASVFSRQYFLKKDDLTLAEACKPSVWTGNYKLRINNAEFHLQPKGIIKQYFRINYKQEEIGVIKRNNIWNYACTVHMPGSIDTSFGIFMIWLAYIYWKNNNAAAASGG